MTSPRKKSKLWKVRMKTLIEQVKTKDSYAQFNLILGRIFLDTNALQYLQDFGEYIFEHYRESEEYFQTRKGKIKKGARLFNEIEALHDFFIGINRAHFEFALAPSVYKEVSASGDKRFVQWFCDVWDHWEAVVTEYENSAPDTFQSSYTGIMFCLAHIHSNQ